MKSKKKVNVNIVVRNVIILIVAVAVLLFVILVPNSGEFSPNVNKSRYRSDKNAEKIKEIYEEAGNKEKFLSDLETIQNAVSMAILSDNVIDEATMENKINEINKELKKSKWETLGIEVPTFWVGTWSVDDSGTVKFTFLNKESMPSWTKDEDVKEHIIV